MSNIVSDNLFEYNDNGTHQFLPLISSHAEIICKNLNEEMNALVKQKISDEKCLSKLSDDESKKPVLISLIILQVRLNSVNDTIKAVKQWFDSENIPYPYSETYIEKTDWTDEISILADEIRWQYYKGELSYLDYLIDAYQFAANNYTWHSKPITADQLKNNYDVSKSRKKYEKLDKKIIPAEE